jgi:hypothetical protein
MAVIYLILPEFIGFYSNLFQNKKVTLVYPHISSPVNNIINLTSDSECPSKTTIRRYQNKRPTSILRKLEPKPDRT